MFNHMYYYMLVHENVHTLHKLCVLTGTVWSLLCPHWHQTRSDCRLYAGNSLGLCLRLDAHFLYTKE